MTTIDMGGFKNEEVDVKFGEDRYKVKTDPPVEVYRLILSILGKKVETEEDWDNYKNITAMIICKSNPDIKYKEFFDTLTKASAEKFVSGYVDILIKAGVLKKVEKPPTEEKKQ